MIVSEVAPSADLRTLLPGAQFTDAYRIEIEGAALTARQAAVAMFARSQRWIEALLALRNLMVAPFGLKTSGKDEPTSGSMIGLFPVISETQGRLVAGFNDRHLDFRVIVEVTPTVRGQQITSTTLVLTHNWLGRVYLSTILPFHRLIARTLLRQTTQAGG
jgi:Protein of unknown function (DUF2867)